MTLGNWVSLSTGSGPACLADHASPARVWSPKIGPRTCKRAMPFSSGAAPASCSIGGRTLSSADGGIRTTSWLVARWTTSSSSHVPPRWDGKNLPTKLNLWS